MLGDVVNKAGEGVGSALGGGVEGLAENFFDLMLSPYGLVAVGLVFLLIRAIR